METLLLLPGLDGTGRLFSPLLQELGHDFDLRPVAYPSDRVLGLDALAEHARAFAPRASRYAIVAESFSGPIALKLAAADSRGLTALILVATFVTPPIQGLLGAFVRAGAGVGMRLPVPLQRWWSARWLTGGDTMLAGEVQTATASVRPTIVASRLRLLTRVDVRRELVLCKVPMLYIAGEHDRLVTRAHHRELTRLRPDIAVRELPAPHLVLQTQPKLAATEILRFAKPSRTHRGGP
jgi:pimeloyl-ACP methyl ester carboxylesterase